MESDLMKGLKSDIEGLRNKVEEIGSKIVMKSDLEKDRATLKDELEKELEDKINEIFGARGEVEEEEEEDKLEKVIRELRAGKLSEDSERVLEAVNDYLEEQGAELVVAQGQEEYPYIDTEQKELVLGPGQRIKLE